MSMHDDGGPAFPMPSGDEPRVNQTTHYNEGMSLRDYFAGQALVGMCASPMPFINEAAQDADRSEWTAGKVLAEQAYMMADAMLKARKQ